MKTLRRTLVAAAAAAAALPALAAGPLQWSQAWSFADPSGALGSTARSEIGSFAAATGELWIGDFLGVSIRDAFTGEFKGTLATGFGEVNSVAVFGNTAAVAVAASNKTDPGQVLFYDLPSRSLTRSVTVGALPDMLTFTPDGSRVVVANEGEPSSLVDPRGSLSVIDVASGAETRVGFGGSIQYKGSHIRTFDGIKGGTTMDWEPEYITLSADGKKAFVTLQEANAIATVDLGAATPRVTTITGLGVKDHSLPGNGMDPSDRDSGNLALRNVPVKGLYQPDGIATYTKDGATYLVMANEGDARADGQDEARASSLGASGELSRLTVSTRESTKDDLYAFGARSFSIRDADGNIVFDSGDELDAEAIARGLYDEGRSDNKGVEPEGVALAEIAGRTYAFIGLERTTKSAVAVYDITDPGNASFVDFIVDENGLRAPEGLTTFTSGGKTYLAIFSEGIETEVGGIDSVLQAGVAVYEVSAIPEPGTWALLLAGLGAVGALARRRRAA
ncbi:MAG: choice-of-anchor I family protein [Rubrivivax sp.]|jgi:hypothetical protein|nr:choice-of-anchor I family protein [Rubrivivax sp.]